METTYLSEKGAVLPISIIIPTYCEEQMLPKLLKSIQGQFFKPYEVIVADAHSTDKTREIALEYGCKVVEGGKISRGRNAGAEAAKMDYLLFLDADTKLPTPYILGEAFFQFLKEDADIASANYQVPKGEKSFFGKVVAGMVYGIWNLVRDVQSLTKAVVTGGGAFILVKKSVYKHIKGFNEKLSVTEDSSFYREARKHGYNYKNLSIIVETSARRYDEPQKVAKMIPWLIFGPLMLGLGVYIGSKANKRWSRAYGRLGGGNGRDPGEEDK